MNGPEDWDRKLRECQREWDNRTPPDEEEPEEEEGAEAEAAGRA